MSGNIQAKTYSPFEMSSICLKEQDIHSTSKSEKSSNPASSPGTSYEVFRNNTTAVEVIVKDVFNKAKKKDFNDMKMCRIQADVDRLHCELDNANKSLVKTRKRFQTILREMRKQIDVANSREADTFAANLALKLENEKLKIRLESKTKILCRIKKELAGIKRVLKFVVKRICNAPGIPSNFELDSEYEDFENGLSSQSKFAAKSDTFDMTVSRDHRNE